MVLNIKLKSKKNEFKLSNYNYFVEHKKKVIYYNGLNDNLFVLKDSEHSKVKNLLSNLDYFNYQFPTFFKKFVYLGFIIDSNFDELLYYKNRVKNSIEDDSFYQLTINPTLKCNFSCWYCSIHLAGAKRKDDYISESTMKNIINISKNKISNKKLKIFILEWFGGEPLLFYNEVIKPISNELFQYSKINNVKFEQHITTNGFLIDSYMIESMSKLNFNSFQITLDGDKRKHNKVRNENGKPSYSRIINNVKQLSNSIRNCIIYFRINYDKKTLLNVNRIINDLNGVNNNVIIISFHRLFQISKFKKEEQLLHNSRKAFEKAGFKLHSWAYQPNRSFACGLDRINHLAINYDGNVFKCNARDYSDKYKVGEVLAENNIVFNDKLREYYKKSTYDNDYCISCKHLPICAGLCIQRAKEFRENTKTNFSDICVVENTGVPITSFIIQKAKELNYI